MGEESPRISHKRVGKLACLHALSAAFAGSSKPLRGRLTPS